jgi:anti-sigma B factor antagonist
MTEPAEDRQERVVVDVDGEIDIANAAELEARLAAASRHGRVVVVDLGRVTFFDASGLSALLGGRRAAIERGGSLLLANVPPFIRRILVLTSLDSVLQAEPES